TLIVEEHDHISKITLNRPNALNAINDKMGEELLATLKDTEKSETVRCLVITGAGRAFSAGEDVAGLKERYGEGAHPSLGDHLRKRPRTTHDRKKNIGQRSRTARTHPQSRLGRRTRQTYGRARPPACNRPNQGTRTIQANRQPSHKPRTARSSRLRGVQPRHSR